MSRMIKAEAIEKLIERLNQEITFETKELERGFEYMKGTWSDEEIENEKARTEGKKFAHLFMRYRLSRVLKDAEEERQDNEDS